LRGIIETGKHLFAAISARYGGEQKEIPSEQLLQLEQPLGTKLRQISVHY